MALRHKLLVLDLVVRMTSVRHGLVEAEKAVEVAEEHEGSEHDRVEDMIGALTELEVERTMFDEVYLTKT